MSGQFGFQATDPLPPHPGPSFDAEDIEELGIDGCLKVWHRKNMREGAIYLDAEATERFLSAMEKERKPLAAPPAERHSSRSET
jgi:hypothetical protein